MAKLNKLKGLQWFLHYTGLACPLADRKGFPIKCDICGQKTSGEPLIG